MLGKIESRRIRVRQRVRWLDGITDSMDISLGKLRIGDGQGGLACCDSWGRKESETTLESPLDCKEIQQAILKEISPGISLEGMMLKLKLQYFDHLMRRVDSLEKTLMLGGIGGRRRRG